MNFESATRSVVRSVRQSDLLSAWLRIANRERALPLIHQFRPERLDEERADLMYYDVHHTSAAVRFMILHGGDSFVRAFGTSKGEGRFLDELVDAERMTSITPGLLVSIEARRPVYTISAVSDVSGVPVHYERLVLPFGANDNAQHLIVSLKTISTEGRFETRDLMRRAGQGPAYLVCAVIDRDVDSAQPKLAPVDDVVEI
jgi:hypothetical protein